MEHPTDLYLYKSMIIYKTKNLLNGKYYIGKDAKNDPYYYGSGIAIKAALKKYGKKNFIKETIEIVGGTDLKKLLEREIFWIDKHDATNDEKSYNIQRNSGLRPRVTTKEETRKRMSQSVKLAWKTNEEYRKKITEHNQGETNPMFGKTQSEYQRKRASEANIGKVYSEETCRKISEAKKGKSYLTDENKKVIGEVTKKRWEQYRLGFPVVNITDETRRKISTAVKKSMTKERRKIISERAKDRWKVKKELYNSGKILSYSSDSTRKKQSDAAKKRWDKYRYEKQNLQSNI